MECDPGSTSKFNIVIRDDKYHSEMCGSHPTIRHASQDKSLMSYSFPDGVVTEEAANLSKCHWSLSPAILPTRKIVDTQIINVGLIQLSVGREKKEREREREREREKERHGKINL